MSRSHNQNSCGRGCSVCGIGELDNERYRLAREDEFHNASLEDYAAFLDEMPDQDACTWECEWCYPPEYKQAIADHKVINLPVTLADAIASRRR